jgi:L-ascorbate metabolism protein UlaG (beta-lactamase superfamily)
MKITFFGHSNFRLDFAGKVVLIDPFFTGNPSFKGDRDAATKGVTHILVTHGHDDHIGDAVAISQATGAKVVTDYDLGLVLTADGLTNLDPMNSGGTTRQDGFQVTLTRAYHSAIVERNGKLVAAGHPHGIVVRAPGEPTVYHMGDTDIFSDMALISEMYRPEVAIVPIGDRFTMGAEAAALALHRFVRPRVAIPCHFGTFPILDQSADRFVELVAGGGDNIKVILPTVGEAFDV